jgi:hypothetical protein
MTLNVAATRRSKLSSSAAATDAAVGQTTRTKAGSVAGVWSWITSSSARVTWPLAKVVVEVGFGTGILHF